MRLICKKTHRLKNAKPFLGHFLLFHSVGSRIVRVPGAFLYLSSSLLYAGAEGIVFPLSPVPATETFDVMTYDSLDITGIEVA